MSGSIEPKILVRSVTRSYRTSGDAERVAVDDLTFDVADGAFVSLLGPSGCGKSTMLRILAGLIDPSAGRVTLRHDDPSRPLCATVFQDYSLFPWRSVRRNIAYGLEVAGLPGDERDRRVSYWIEQMGLGGFEKAKPHELSGGMRQRVALARAMVLEPEILLMDEPFAALDAQTRALLQEELLRVCAHDGRTVVFVTHSIDEAILLSDRILVMTARPGRLDGEFPVPFDHPRGADLRTHASFTALVEEIWSRLRPAVEITSGVRT